MLQPLAVVAHHLVSKMDFQFTSYQGATLAKCSMEHEAVAHWFNTETPINPQLIQQVLQQLEQLQPDSQQEIRFIGAEYSLFINADEVMIKANNMELGNEEELEQDFHYYDAESIAFCGLEDFQHFLQSALVFCKRNR